MKYLFLFFSLISPFSLAQIVDYQKLENDKNNIQWWYAFDKKTENGFYAWLKSTFAEDQDPSTTSIEMYMEFHCADQSMSEEIVKINWRNEAPEITNKKMPFQRIPQKHISQKLIAEFCTN